MDTAIRLCVLLFVVETTIVIFWVSAPNENVLKDEKSPVEETTILSDKAVDAFLLLNR